jgi:hypothetical protein
VFSVLSLANLIFHEPHVRNPREGRLVVDGVCGGLLVCLRIRTTTSKSP